MRKKTSARSACVFAQNCGAVLAVIAILAGELTFETKYQEVYKHLFYDMGHVHFFKDAFLGEQKKRLRQDTSGTKSLKFWKTHFGAGKKRLRQDTSGTNNLIFFRSAFLGEKKAPAARCLGQTKLGFRMYCHRFPYISLYVSYFFTYFPIHFPIYIPYIGS